MAQSHAAQIQATDICFQRGAELIIEGFTQTISGGDRLGLVGPNGAGKSTLLQLLSGALQPSSGTIARSPAQASVGLLAQELRPLPGQRVGQLIDERTGVAAAKRNFESAAEALATGSASWPVGTGGSEPEAATVASPLNPPDFDQALEYWLQLGGADLEHRTPSVLSGLGLEAEVVDRDAASLSGGEQARIGLAVVLLSRFDLLLLDEPTNNLDLAGLGILEEFLLDQNRPFIVVSHDRRFMDRVVNGVIELDGHDRTTTFYRGDWASYRAQRKIAERQAQERFDRFSAERRHLVQQRQEAKRRLNQGVKAAREHPDNDKALRNAQLERTENNTAAGKLNRALDRQEVVDKPWQAWQLQFEIGQSDRSGDLVAELREATLTLGDFTLGPLDLAVHAGDRLVIAGPNGSGKTTLIRLLLRELTPESGVHRMGAAVVVGELDQARSHYCGQEALLGGFLERTGASPSDARSVLAKFGLKSDHLRRAGDVLSPGERTRACLAEFQLVGVNTLVLDEPTNHLDLMAIEQLEQALGFFKGTVLLVSHDRAFRAAFRSTGVLWLEDGTLSELDTETPNTSPDRPAG